jgi:hypothetical protein
MILIMIIIHHHHQHHHHHHHHHLFIILSSSVFGRSVSFIPQPPALPPCWSAGALWTGEFTKLVLLMLTPPPSRCWSAPPPPLRARCGHKYLM